MEPFYLVTFAVLAGATAFLELSKGKDGTLRNANQEFFRFRNNYVLVYALMIAGDWLQGPYVYALYQHYGFSKHEIALLFIAGFGSSLLFGTVAGSLADKLGRRRAALAYAATYSLACLTKHSASFGVLLAGRALCGVATSLLACCFEAWVVAEHVQRGYDADWLGGLFSMAVFVGNGLVAILSGLLAHYLVDALDRGPVAPFDAAAAVMCVGAALVALTWRENYGEGRAQTTFRAQMREAFSLLQKDPKILMLAAMQALFEAAMYTFVFLWTPALSPQGEKIPHGFIFACFMVACMGGSALAGSLLADSKRHAVEHYMQIVFTLSALTMAVPVAVHLFGLESTPDLDTGSITWAGAIQVLAFCGFEFLVGIFWPSMMQMRARFVPEGVRATLISIFRIPLNLFVCVVLYNVSRVPVAAMFGLCAAMLGAAALCQRHLFFLSVQTKADRVLHRGLDALNSSPTPAPHGAPPR